MSIIFATAQHGPGHASQFVGDRNHDLIARSTLREPAYPLPESPGVVLHAQQYSAGTVDQHATQIDVAALADAQQLLLAPGGVLPWHDADALRGKEESEIVGKVSALLIGVGIGVGVRLLIAPASGDETRADVADKVSDFDERVRERTIRKKPQGATGTTGE
jgi:hypothetical protein